MVQKQLEEDNAVLVDENEALREEVAQLRRQRSAIPAIGPRDAPMEMESGSELEIAMKRLGEVARAVKIETVKDPEKEGYRPVFEYGPPPFTSP